MQKSFSVKDLVFDLSTAQITRVASNEITNMLTNGTGTLSNENNFNEMRAQLSESTTPSPLKLSSSESLVKHVLSPKGNRHISAKVFNAIKDGKYSHLFDHFVVIDCRFDYEFNGGHIEGALNIQSPELLELLFKTNMSTQTDNHRIAWIFHCEFSQKRGPRAASFVRNLDRTLNQLIYPQLCFPHCYVLDGGYRNYFKAQTMCQSPVQSYTPMMDKKYRSQLNKSAKMEKSVWGESRSRCKPNKKNKTRSAFANQIQKIKREEELNAVYTGIFLEEIFRRNTCI